MIDPEMIGKSVDATKAVAEAGGKGIDLLGKAGHALAPAFEPLVGLMRDQGEFWRFKRRVELIERAEQLMAEKGIERATRALPPKFAMPLLEKATLEDDADLRERWARLLVNAADAATPMELRTSYVSALSELSAYDARNLHTLAAASMTVTPAVTHLPTIETWDLPDVARVSPEKPGVDPGELSEQLLESLACLGRAGCIVPFTGFGGMAIFTLVTVTGFGRALYRAVS